MASSLILNRKPQVAAQDTAAFGPIAERFRRAGDLERAVSLCREGLQRFPQHISARVTLGWALLDLGKYDEARIELEQVLRRRADNLAAIRGLAELHDRSEHTLNLPMDGPGQWPPDAAAVDYAATAKGADAVSILGSGPVDEPIVFTAGDVSELASESLQYGPVVLTPAELGSAVWSSVPPPEPAAPPSSPVAPPSAPAAPPSASVEPLMAPPSAIHLDAVAEMEAVEIPVVSEADIAALIAEADSLEAAAESQAIEPELVLDSSIDLGPFDDMALDLPGGGLPLVSDAPAAPAPESAVLAVATDIRGPVEIREEPVLEDPVLDEPVLHAAEAYQVEDTALALEGVAHAHIAEVVSLARVADALPVRSPVAALERFLQKVHARRQQVMTESVA